MKFFSLLLLGLAATTAHATTADPSFTLTATSKDFDNYFPGYLANGYFSTLTGPRGTEGNLSYMVGLMDYAIFRDPPRFRAGPKSTTRPANPPPDISG